MSAAVNGCVLTSSSRQGVGSEESECHTVRQAAYPFLYSMCLLCTTPMTLCTTLPKGHGEQCPRVRERVDTGLRDVCAVLVCVVKGGRGRIVLLALHSSDWLHRFSCQQLAIWCSLVPFPARACPPPPPALMRARPCLAHYARVVQACSRVRKWVFISSICISNGCFWCVPVNALSGFRACVRVCTHTHTHGVAVPCCGNCQRLVADATAVQCCNWHLLQCKCSPRKDMPCPVPLDSLLNNSVAVQLPLSRPWQARLLS